MTTLTDISSEIEEVFDEMECCADTDLYGPHDGDKAAYYDAHGCYAGFLCQHHLDKYILEMRPGNAKGLMVYGALQCGMCWGIFYNLEDMDKVYPL